MVNLEKEISELNRICASLPLSHLKSRIEMLLESLEERQFEIEQLQRKSKGSHHLGAWEYIGNE